MFPLKAKPASARIIPGLFAAVLMAVTGCKPAPAPVPEENAPTPTPTPVPPKTKKVANRPPPSPTPTPSPTPIHIPRKVMETAKLFNGVRLKTTFQHEPGRTATLERNTEESFTVEIKVNVKVPKANQDLAALSEINPALPTLLPGLESMLATAKVAPAYESIYGRKIARVERNLSRLDALLPKHDFFDCETILYLRDPNTKRAAILVQADMDVDTDGSDGDRIPNPEGTDTYFQPMTSYAWPKQTSFPNPFLAKSEAKLAAVQQELAKAKGLGPERMAALREQLGAARYEANRIRTQSFLISSTDPYIVLPGFMFEGRDKNPTYTPRFGDYAAVIFGDTIYPAIVGDAGPSVKAGEASVRLCKQLNPKSTAYSRPVSSLKVTYLVFPNSAEAKPEPPNLDLWRQKVEGLLNEFGGYGGTLFAWETTARPVPTPTPSPTPAPVPTPEGSPTPGGETTPVPGATPALPAASPSPAQLPGATPMPTVPATPEPPVTASNQTSAPSASPTPAPTAPQSR